MSEVSTSVTGEENDGMLHELLRKRLSQIEQERAKLVKCRSEVERELSKLEEERGHIAALLGVESRSGLPTEVVGETVPSEPADLVVKLLRETGPLHYREIERELRSRGWYRAGGVDPANTLLAKYYRDSRLYRPRRGVYAIRPDGVMVQSVGARRKGPSGRRHRSTGAS